MSGDLTRYRVHLRSVPGPITQYEGHVDVWAADEEEAPMKAFRELRRTSFPERGPACWRVLSVERRT